MRRSCRFSGGTEPTSGNRTLGRKRVRLAHILDLFGEDSQLNVYAGELEVRPPSAPTIGRLVGRSPLSYCHVGRSNDN
jgi:hypothetical protein